MRNTFINKSNRLSTLLIFISILGCSSISNDLERKRIIEQTSVTWKQLGHEYKDTLIINSDSLNYFIEFSDNYYLLPETNKLFFSFLICQLDSLLDDFEYLNINYTYKDLKGGELIRYDKESFGLYKRHWQNNPTFQSVFLFTINNLNTNEIIGFENLRKDCQKFISDKYNHQGSFWSLLYDYSQQCCDSTSIPSKSINILHHASKYPKNQLRPEIIEGIKEICMRKCNKNAS